MFNWIIVKLYKEIISKNNTIKDMSALLLEKDDQLYGLNKELDWYKKQLYGGKDDNKV